LKPDTVTAMRLLIAQVRGAIPFDAPQGQVCSADCTGCSQKLLEFLDSELRGWEQRLDAGERPNLGDVSKLGRTSRKVYGALERNGVVGPLPPAEAPPGGRA
jgi:hypothetical protein